MTRFSLWLGAATAFVASSAIVQADDSRAMPVDRPVEVDGFDLACTGVGAEAKDNPVWRDYPVRIEFANRDAQYLSDIDVTVRAADGKSLFTVLCQSPWLLTRLQPGKYTAVGTFEGVTQETPFTVRASGKQQRVIVTFKEVAGDRPN